MCKILRRTASEHYTTPSSYDSTSHDQSWSRHHTLYTSRSQNPATSACALLFAIENARSTSTTSREDSTFQILTTGPTTVADPEALAPSNLWSTIIFLYPVLYQNASKQASDSMREQQNLKASSAYNKQALGPRSALVMYAGLLV